MTATGPVAAAVLIEGLVKHYRIAGARGRRRTVKAVDGVSFRIGEGETVGLVGESGSGKSTVARLLTRLTEADAGSVQVGGTDVLRLRPPELRRFRQSMQLIFQDPFSALDPRMRIGTSLEAPLAQHRIGDRGERKGRVLRMLAEVGLDHSFYDRLPRQCSGGQPQRAVIARALLLHPRFLICDEPTSALDAAMRAQILNLLVEMRRRFSLTVLMISHDLRVIHYLCDRIAVMYLGQIVELAERSVLFESSAHPYTRALIASSLLEVNGLRADDELARGEPPSAFDPPSGCRFHSRCAFATQRCAREAPQLAAIGPHHLVRCHFWREVQAAHAREGAVIQDREPNRPTAGARPMEAAEASRTAHASTNMGHGQIVRLFDRGEGRWELLFSLEERGPTAAPPVSEIKVDAIARNGQVRSLTVVGGPGDSSAIASGRTDDAHRARIMVWHGNHFHTREVDVPGSEPVAVTIGARGGSMIDMGHDSLVEVTPANPGQWQLSFIKKGAQDVAPATDDVKAEAIVADGRVRALTIMAGSQPSTLLAVGNLDDATHVRLAVMHGDHYHTRSVPVVGA